MFGLIYVGTVDSDMLDAHEILAIRRIFGDGTSDPVPVIIAPGVFGEVTTLADPLLIDLEPVSRPIIGLDTAWGLRHIDETRTRMLHRCTDSKLEANFVTSIDGQHVRVRTRRCTLVASDVWTIGKRAVANVRSRIGGELDRIELRGAGGLADILVVWLLDPVDNVGVEEVMRVCHLGNGAENNSRELHSGRAVMVLFEVRNECRMKRASEDRKRQD